MLKLIEFMGVGSFKKISTYEGKKMFKTVGVKVEVPNKLVEIKESL